MKKNTLAEKIIANKLRLDDIKVGETYFVEPDRIFMYNWPGITDKYMSIVESELEVGQLPFPERVVFFMDHFLPPLNQQQYDLYNKSKLWCKKYAVRFEENCGIGHSVAIDTFLITPGQLATHFDMHVSTVGAVGALGIGVMAELVMALSCGVIWITIPPTIRIDLYGEFQKGVGARDLLAYLVEQHGPSFANGHIVEFGGPGARNISIDARMSICDLSNYFGAITSIFVPDVATREYYNSRGIENLSYILPDDDAEYSMRFSYDLDKIVPTLTIPPTISKAEPLEMHIGQKVDVGIIGTCAAGRIDDLRDAAEILDGKKIADGFRLFISPSSNDAYFDGVDAGYIQSLIKAGAYVLSPTCDICYGKTIALFDGQTAISTQTLNVPGRLGSTKSKIYLGSASAVATAALYGEIADPRK